MSTLIPFGVRAGNIVHISEVHRGLDCDCTCPECGGGLIAKKGSIREHHFAHSNSIDSVNCKGGGESILHKYAKRIIEEAGYLVVPSFKVTLPPPNEHKYSIIGGGKIEFSRVDIEDSLVIRGRKIDVVGYHGTSRLLIEIFVTHRVNEKKLRQVRAANEALIEIGVPRNILFSPEADGGDSLRGFIVDNVDCKNWLYHPEGAKELRLLEESTITSQDQITKINNKEPASTSSEKSSSTSSTGAHLPDRKKCSTHAEYVCGLHEFFAASKYNSTTRQHVITALMRSGNIIDADIKLSEILGINLINSGNT
jgi:competence protein CoiA